MWDQIRPKVRVIAVRGWWECGGGGGGCTAAAVKSMEQPRRRNAARLRAACSRWRDVYRFRRRYRRRDAPETVCRNDITNRRFRPVTTMILLSLCRRFAISLLFRKRTPSHLAAVYNVYILMAEGRTPG